MFLEPPFDPCEEPGKERAPALAKRLQRFSQATNGAFSTNTERALRSDLAIYAEWCAERGERVLPASSETVAAFIDAMAETRAPATVRRYVASIATAHRAIGLEKTLKSPTVRLALKRMHRRKGRRQDQAAGLTWPLRRRLLAAAGNRLIDDRNRALLAVAYDAMLRRTELTSLEVSDFLEEIGGDGSLLVRRSKTDGEGQGEIVWIGPDTVRLVRAWLDRGRDRRRAAVPFGRQGRADRRGAPSQPGAAHLQGDGAGGRPAGRSGGRPLGAFGPGGRGPGHDRRRHRTAGDPPRRSVEVHRHGEPLRRAAIGAAQRRGATGADAGAGLSRAGGVRVKSMSYNGGASGAGCGGELAAESGPRGPHGRKSGKCYRE